MRKSVLSLLLLFLTLGVAWAQKRQITVSGTVLSSIDKEPVVAASVVCTDFPGTGAVTDTNGHFSFKVPADARTLTISCIGYTTQKVAISATPMNIILKSEERVTEAVVVTGMSGERAMDAEELAGIARDVFGRDRVEVERDLLAAIDRAATLAEEDDDAPMTSPAVVVTGSIQLVGAARSLMGRPAPDGA